MNYIKRLEHELAEAKQDKADALDALNDLRRYLQSAKFTSLNAEERRFLVNTQDVHDRIAPAILALLP